MTASPARCRALLVSAPASGQGKTTVTAALARAWQRQGLRVRIFKTGPDFLDPMVLARAARSPCWQLDQWMGGEADVQAQLWRAAQEADVLLVEGVMGLYDGSASSAALAARFGLPVLAVINASAMAQTFGALAHGLATYPGAPAGLQLAGVLANRVGSAGHAEMLRESLPPGITWFGGLARDERWTLPERHLGLVAADELDDLDARLDAAADALMAQGLPLPPEVRFAPPPSSPELTASLAGLRIAIARDAAFAFLYPANLALLQDLGAELSFFSPLANEAVPEGAQALYLPGGYPELHLDVLAAAQVARDSVLAHHQAGRPLVAECGGLLALAEGLTDKQGRRAAMWGLLPGEALMQPRLVNLGMHSVEVPAAGTVRGHTFHHAAYECPLPASGHSTAQRHHGRPEAVYQQGRLWASFVHLYLPSNPAAAVALFKP
ncbi:cobyrinate a,c-diamide synthase [Ideonella azotifigens]|uniref:Cobyrinate a,c-diamide synthase n=1 Tax=Ideonella azotifigens TaxID=513160 RepID=A0ABN1KEP7_9BURK|nr:cobyrinate a,c-diamide synthase [Ideonella azotifigens]MCD2340771.1 cobyrinate a,c-diamide synthase [Ideonella azotifigens]